MEESIYYEGDDATVSFDHVDHSGQQITPISVVYTILDKDGNEILGTTAGVVGLDPTVIEIDGTYNTFDVDFIGDTDYRLVKAEFDDGTNTVTHMQGYFIKKVTALVAGENSFQTLESAKVTSLDIVNSDSFNTATDSEKITALKNAFNALRKYTVNIYYGQDHLYSGYRYVTLSTLTAEQMNSLDSDLLNALKRAQVIQSNFLMLPENSLIRKRREGMLSETIGESSNMFRTSKPIQTIVCREALDELSEYIVTSKKIGRAS